MMDDDNSDAWANLDDADDGHPVFCSRCEDAGHVCEMELCYDHWACPHCDFVWVASGSTDPGDPGRF